VKKATVLMGAVKVAFIGAVRVALIGAVKVALMVGEGLGV
jgi:hypothetical protein